MNTEQHTTLDNDSHRWNLNRQRDATVGSHLYAQNEGKGILSGEDLDRLANLYVVARLLVDGLYQGKHVTAMRGSSTEFHDYRMYVSGDDLRSVDWKVYAKTDRYYIRQYRHFGNLTLQVLIDGSASMDFAFPTGIKPKNATGKDNADQGRSGLRGMDHQGVTKWKYATWLAAALSFLVIRSHDRVETGIISEGRVQSTGVGGNWGHLHHILHTLEKHHPGGGTQLDNALIRSVTQDQGRRLVIIISDFLPEDNDANVDVYRMDDLRTSIQRFLHDGCEVLCVQVLTRTELDLSGIIDQHRMGMYSDSESGRRVRTNPAAIQKQYETRMRQHIEGLRKMLAGCSAGHLLATTDAIPLQTLRTILRMQQHRVR